MGDKKPKVIKKEEIEAREEYQTRHEKSLLKILAEKHPDDAIKYAKESKKLKFCVV